MNQATALPSEPQASLASEPQASVTDFSTVIIDSEKDSSPSVSKRLPSMITLCRSDLPLSYSHSLPVSCREGIVLHLHSLLLRVVVRSSVACCLQLFSVVAPCC